MIVWMGKDIVNLMLVVQSNKYVKLILVAIQNLGILKLYNIEIG